MRTRVVKGEQDSMGDRSVLIAAGAGGTERGFELEAQNCRTSLKFQDENARMCAALMPMPGDRTRRQSMAAAIPGAW